ncbi:YdcF family protein [Paenibacillus sp. PL2-23]|uniref:YdcF family protein n=1 Tax=Paenibacillus sp. PL2-23 TaxID=2100729 RepID=UPI0030F72EB2
MIREISKEPPVPILNDDQIATITEAVFMKEIVDEPKCDVIFVFGGKHPGHWLTAISAYRKGLGSRIIVTGGLTNNNKRAGISEAEIIKHHLLEADIPREVILLETRSCNTLENVLFARDLFDFSNVRSLLFVCKSHSAGRQYRTLKKHLSPDIRYIPAIFDTEYQGVKIRRDSWADTEIGRSRVYGEYLRICRYGDRGDIERLEDRLRLD